MRDDNRVIFKTIYGNYSFLPRAEAERDRAYRQIIPYAVIMGRAGVYATYRLSTGGEERLHGLYSIGIGGHINICDMSSDPVSKGLERELREELIITEASKPHFLGIINDDSNEVGSVHLGLFYLISITSGEVSVRETEKLSGLWLTARKLEEYMPRMETWSRIAAAYILGRRSGGETLWIN